MDQRVWKKKYDSGVPQEVEVPEIPLHKFLEESARKFAGRPATIFKGAKLSYAQLNEQTDRLAAGLVALGVKKGDRVAIFRPFSAYRSGPHGNTHRGDYRYLRRAVLPLSVTAP